MENIFKIIAEHSLTVRCLPHEVVSFWNYREGDENKKYIDAHGNPIIKDIEVITQNHDLEYFKNTPAPYFSNETPEQRFEAFKKRWPNGRKLLKETKKVSNGGWWYVKETKNTSSTVTFNRKHDRFFAPTLEEAINLYLESLK